MSNNVQKEETSRTNADSSHHPHQLKKNLTYSTSMDQQAGQIHEKNLHLYMHRTNSLVSEMPEEQLDELHNGDYLVNQSNLHRTKEVEDLTEKLLDEQDNLTKSNKELFDHHAHLKRTNELENLNVDNDE
jgi:hypothetical protein